MSNRFNVPANLQNVVISKSDGTAQTICAGVTGQRVKIHSLALTVASAQTIELLTNAGATSLGKWTVAAGVPLVLALRPEDAPHTIGIVDKDVTIICGGSVLMSGIVQYVQE